MPPPTAKSNCRVAIRRLVRGALEQQCYAGREAANAADALTLAHHPVDSSVRTVRQTRHPADTERKAGFDARQNLEEWQES